MSLIHFIISFQSYKFKIIILIPAKNVVFNQWNSHASLTNNIYQLHEYYYCSASIWLVGFVLLVMNISLKLIIIALLIA